MPHIPKLPSLREEIEEAFSNIKPLESLIREEESKEVVDFCVWNSMPPPEDWDSEF